MMVCVSEVKLRVDTRRLETVQTKEMARNLARPELNLQPTTSRPSNPSTGTLFGCALGQGQYSSHDHAIGQ